MASSDEREERKQQPKKDERLKKVQHIHHLNLTGEVARKDASQLESIGGGPAGGK